MSIPAPLTSPPGYPCCQDPSYRRYVLRAKMMSFTWSNFMQLSYIFALVLLPADLELTLQLHDVCYFALQHLNTSTALLSSNLGILSPASSQNGTLRTTDVNQFIVQACSYISCLTRQARVFKCGQPLSFGSSFLTLIMLSIRFCKRLRSLLCALSVSVEHIICSAREDKCISFRQWSLCSETAVSLCAARWLTCQSHLECRGSTCDEMVRQF